jgi:hypothetical protein
VRFPWLQVDADFIGAHAGDLGAHLGIGRREAMGLALDLWTWALARARDDAPPDGMVTGTGTVPDRLLAGSVEWTGPAESFTAALVAVGLAVRVDGGYRLTGFDRYRATWEKNRRRTGAKPERNRSGTGEEPVRKTQTQTQTQTQKAEEEKPSAAAVASPGGQGTLVQVAEKPKAPRKQPEGEHHALWRALEAEYLRVMGHPYASGNAGADATAVKWLRETAKAAPDECVRRWGNLLTWSRTGWPSVTGFQSLRQHWVAPQVIGNVTPRGVQGPATPSAFTDEEVNFIP